MDGPIARQWDSYREMVLRPDAPLVQVCEMRRAFYAGVQASIRIFDASPDDEAGENEYCDQLGTELAEFVRDVAEGRS